ncbi:hypothetical protein JNW87_22570, partial [Micromonospora sp. ATA51]|nr:hypothetical protein [Micromonospora sp. ATA51]
GRHGPGDAAPVRQFRLWLDRDARCTGWWGGCPTTPRSPCSWNAATGRPAPGGRAGRRPGLPRALTDAEAVRLAGLPTRLRAAGGAALTGIAPLGPTKNLRAAGWLSWAGSAAYLAVGEIGTPGRRTLLRHQAGRSPGWRYRRTTARRSAGPTTAAAAGRPPLAAPHASDRRPGPARRAALGAVGTPADTRSAVRLRADRLADRTVDVVELREHGAQLRYWIDREGLLRRVELRTGRGVWAQLDLTPAPVPALPTTTFPPTAR